MKHIHFPTWISLMLVLFIDGVSQGIVFPIFTKALFDTHSPLLSASATVLTRNIWYGVLVSAFFFTWFLGAALLSDLSDMIGRKRTLVICLAGSAMGNGLSGLAFLWNNIWVLLAGRLIVGLTTANQPIAQAAIVDITPKEKLGRSFGLLITSFSLGVIAGPLLGGYLSSRRYVFWFSNAIPFYFAAILPFVNIFLLLFFLPETSKFRKKIVLHPLHAIGIFLSAFRHRSVRFLTICYLFFQSGWSLYYVYIAAYLVKKYFFSKKNISIVLALLGVGVSIGLTVLSSIFEKEHINRKWVIFICYLLSMIMIFATVFPNEAYWSWIVMIPIGMSVGLAYTFLLSLFSHQVSVEKQGWVMGITSSAFALAGGIVSLIEGFLSSVDVKLPLYICIALIGMGSMLFSFFHLPVKGGE